MNISIIIFCFNESGTIASVISSAHNTLSDIAQKFEIVVVNDGSTDNTGEIAEALSLKYLEVKVINHHINSGIGNALISGYAAAQYEYVCAIPGDGQFDINELRQIQNFKNDSFYSFYRIETEYNLYRKCLNLMNRVYNKALLGMDIKDVNWIKVYRRDQLNFVQIKLKSSIVESEICAKLMKAGCIPLQIESNYHKRISGTSKGGSWKTLNKVLREMVPLFFIILFFNKKIS